MSMLGCHHTEETRKKLSEQKRGGLNPMYGVRLCRGLNSNWKGGKICKDGYVMVLKPEHPYCDRDGYVFEHRLVLEEKLGRYLLPSEVSHHLNNIKDDNHPENLAIYDNHSPHMQEHTLRRQRNARGQFMAA